MNWQERSVKRKKNSKERILIASQLKKKALKWYSVKICHTFDLSKFDWKAIVTFINNLVTLLQNKKKCITSIGTHWHSPTNVLVFYWMQCRWYRQEVKNKRQPLIFNWIVIVLLIVHCIYMVLHFAFYSLIHA